jgi:predicted CopG family antitoxin
VGWKVVRLRDDVYARLKARAKQYGAFSISEAVAKLLDMVESVENNGVEKPLEKSKQQKGALVILNDYTIEWLDEIRRYLSKALNNEFRFGAVDLTLSDILDIIGFALMMDEDVKYRVNAMIIKAITNAIRKTARSGITPTNTR